MSLQQAAQWIHRQLLRSIGKARVIFRVRQIRRRDFCIIASNCTGSLPYRFLKLPYNTPTVNLFFYAPDFIRFVQRLDHYLAQPLRFTPISKFPDNAAVHEAHGNYPIGRLDDIEVHFMHYINESEAEEKWNRRKLRINRDNLVIAFTDKDLCTPELLADFDNLPYPRKFVLTAQQHPMIKSSVQVPAYADASEVGDTYTNFNTLAHIDFAELLDRPAIETADNPVPAVVPTTR
ncbi:MAG: DUF1919 domain-containing protein [Granulosicoccus sp.]|nr:DUF1919 domain-containing protein [Granulosicoccus sp.]